MDNIYVHLESDSSPNFFPENTISDFRNQLAFELDINPVNYEVALVQCSYVYNPPYLRKGMKIGEVRQWNSLNNIEYDDTRAKILQSSHFRPDSKLLEEKTHLILDSELSELYKTKDISKYNLYQKDALNEIPQNLKDDFATKFSIITLCRVFHQFPVDINSIAEMKEYLLDIFKFYGKKSLDDTKLLDHHLQFSLDGNVANFLKKPELFVPISKGTKYLYVNYINKIQALGSLKLNFLPFSNFVKIPKTYIKRTKITTSDYFNEIHGSQCTLQSRYETTENDNKIELEELVHELILPEDVFSVDEVINHLNEELSFVNFSIENNFVIANPSAIALRKYFRLFLEEKTMAILGVNDHMVQNVVSSREPERAEFRPYFGYGQQKMYIYVDAIENQHVGGMMAPLLRIADYKGESQKTTNQEFLHHHYVPLKNIVLDQIRMYIRTETSDYLPIEHGTFSATLHFRKKRY